MRRKDESHRRDRQKKEEWIGGKMSRKDESHGRDRQDKSDQIVGEMKKRAESSVRGGKREKLQERSKSPGGREGEEKCRKILETKMKIERKN